MLFPRRCLICGSPLVQGEKVMCLSCRLALPVTSYTTPTFNELHHRLAPEPVDKAQAMFYYFRESRYARLIHQAKYNQRPWIIRQMGVEYGRELLEKDFFQGIDTMVPVPLSWLKLRIRGYNQALELAKGISKATGVGITTGILQARNHAPQARRSFQERTSETSNIFYAVGADKLRGKHILVVDDVITTGTTMLACLRALRTQVPELQISVLALGATHLR